MTLLWAHGYIGDIESFIDLWDVNLHPGAIIAFNVDLLECGNLAKEPFRHLSLKNRNYRLYFLEN